VADSLLKGGNFKVRAVTRNPASDKAKALAARGAELVQADFNDKASLSKVSAGQAVCRICAVRCNATSPLLEHRSLGLRRKPTWRAEAELAQATTLCRRSRAHTAASW
jgi:NmrA-like family